MIGWRMDLDLRFPSGVSAGEGHEGSRMLVARDGQQRPVLRGTALAGVLRSAYACEHQDGSDWFGEACEAGDEACRSSRLVVEDTVLGKPADVLTRTFHARDRHTGTVLDGGLFSMEATPPETSCRAVLWLEATDADDADADRGFLESLAVLFRDGLTVGGRSNRGVGLAELTPKGACLRCYDLDDLEDHAAWLDDRRSVRTGESASPGEPCAGVLASPVALALRVSVRLAIPRGQDVLIGDGEGLAHSIEPQSARSGERVSWRFPGSSFRGAFRAWCNRLATRELADSHAVADSLPAYRDHILQRGERPRGDDLGWCHMKPGEPGADGPGAECPVADLFGSLHRRGRLHISDAMVAEPCLQPQVRRHVGVDRISGGAVEGQLFDSLCLTDPQAGEPAELELTFVIRSPEERDAIWLARCLTALHLGLIRVGSSKSAGRLIIRSLSRADGAHSEIIREAVESLLKREVETHV